MNKNVQSPCLGCTRVKNPGSCENKSCRVWANWFLGRWEDIHGFYEKYTNGKGAENELEK